MDKEMQQAIDQITKEYHEEIEKSMKALLASIDCEVYEDTQETHKELAEKGYDIARYNFDSNSFKTFVCLTTLTKQDFERGYLIEFDPDNIEITRELIKSKKRYEKIIKPENSRTNLLNSNNETKPKAKVTKKDDDEITISKDDYKID
jgi:hypothetical protein